MSISKGIERMKNYSYINTRVRARRGNLITDQEYRKLVKMDIAEIAEFMGKRGYKEEIEELGQELEGEDLVERALRKNFSRTYTDLMKMSPQPVQDLLSIYFRKFDIQTLKRLLRKKIRGSKEDITEMLIPTDELDRKEIERLESLPSTEEVLHEFSISGFNGDVTEKISDFSNLREVEDALDIYYYENVVEKISGMGSDSLFKRFLELEAALKNVSLILRMNRRGYSYEEIRENLIDVPRRHQVIDNSTLARADHEEAVRMVEESSIGGFVDVEAGPGQVEKALEKYKLKQGIQLMHRDQLGVNPVLGFMVCKEVEVKNLRTIVRSKEENLEEDFMKRNIVTGVAK